MMVNRTEPASRQKTRGVSLGILVAAVLGVGGCGSVSEEARSGNPLFGGAWYADPEVVIHDDTYWIFPTLSTEFALQTSMDAFSSPDLVEWTRHEGVVDTAIVRWARYAMWAPAHIRKGDRYYLFFAANDLQRPGSPWWDPARHGADDVGGIGVAVADAPGGPYEDLLGHPLIGEVHNGAQPIDQFVFRDADGRDYIIYGGWGRCNVALLNEDYTGLVPFADGSTFREITPTGYVEGPVMFLRNGRYYFMWSEGDWTNGSYRVAYAIADSVFGPFERLGTVLTSDSSVATGAGHHSVMHHPGTDEWYIVYHRRPIPNEGPNHRVTAIDRMYFNADGTIRPIRMTVEGVTRRELP